MQTGQERFTLGIPELRDGIGTILVAVGMLQLEKRYTRLHILTRELMRLYLFGQDLV
jgi:TctA family transporter